MPTEEEFGVFLQTLYDKLPVTFRLNSGEAGFQRVSKMLKDADFIKQFLEAQDAAAATNAAQQPEEEAKTASGAAAVNMDQTTLVTQSIKELDVDYSKIKMEMKGFYPHEVLFEMCIPRELLKKHAGLKKIHKLVMQMADSGLITR